MNPRNLILLLIAAFHPYVLADQWPDDASKIHKLLNKQSHFYHHMVTEIDRDFKLIFIKTNDIKLGNVKAKNDILYIELHPSLKNERLATVLIWEIANAYQRKTFDEIAQRVLKGEITTAKEYGLRMELVEYSSFRYHKQVLDDIASKKGDLNGEYLFFINPSLKKLSEYNLPLVHDYIDAQASGGHTAHYERWFDKIQ